MRRRSRTGGEGEQKDEKENRRRRSTRGEGEQEK